jgi:hypothetical protein
MRTARSNGFILTLVILFLGVMAVVLLVLTDGTQTMLSQTDRMYLSAVENNLVSSGAAWASTQLSADRLAASNQATDLDAKLLSDRPCAVSVRLANRTDDQANVRISTSCSKARWTFTHSCTYAIPTR